MNERARIVDLLRRAYDSDAWHGPALKELLADVTAKQAAARPIPGAHTIWELVLHVATWERCAAKRLQARPGERHEPSPEENFPSVTDVSEAAWKDTLDELKDADERLRAMILQLGEDARLEDGVPEQPYNAYLMLHGVVQHNLYHAGQIALLKKAG